MLKRYYKQFAWFLKKNKRDYLLLIPLVLLSYFLSLCPPRLVGRIADGLLENRLDLHQLFLQLLLFLGIILSAYVVEYFWGYLLFRADDRINYLCRQRIFRCLLRQGPAFYARHTTGSIMGRATNDVTALGSFVGYGMMTVLDATIWPLALYIMLFSLSPRLALLSSVPLPLLVILSQKIGLKLYVRYAEAQEAFDQLNQSVLEGVSGVRVVRAYSLETSEAEGFREKCDALFRKNMRAVSLTQLYAPVTKFLPGLSFLIALGVGLSEIHAGRMSSGSLLSFLFYLAMLTWPMISIGEFINTGQQGSASMERIDALLDDPPDVDDCEIQGALPERFDLAMHDLSFTYPQSSAAALQDICFTLEEGRTLGLVGPVGSGKTTLLKQFLHFYPLQDGSISLGGKDLKKIDRKALRGAISYVPQENFLFSQTVKENILLGASDEALADGRAEERLRDVLEWADFEKDLPQLDHGLETKIGEKGITLSGGQKQRLAIARALMEDRPILILDDCLSAVDAITEEHILRSLRAVRRGRTSLIAAHRFSAVRDADLILVLAEGRVADCGTHEELLQREGWYKEQYERSLFEEEEAIRA